MKTALFLLSMCAIVLVPTAGIAQDGYYPGPFPTLGEPASQVNVDAIVRELVAIRNDLLVPAHEKAIRAGELNDSFGEILQRQSRALDSADERTGRIIEKMSIWSMIEGWGKTALSITVPATAAYFLASWRGRRREEEVFPRGKA